MCEDYRAGAYADYDHDKADFAAGRKITIPMLALWGDAGIAGAAATPLETWKQWATNLSGAAMNPDISSPRKTPPPPQPRCRISS